jgi:hypothetical protein
MKAFVKIRDMLPGEVSAEKIVEMPADDPAAIRYVQEIAKVMAEEHPEAWMVTVELQVGLACILDPEKKVKGKK